MTKEKLKVKTDFFQTHLQLFVTATVEKLNHGEPLEGIQEEYVSNIRRIQALAQECLSELQNEDPWRRVFEIVKEEADNLYNTMLQQFPVLEHVHVLERMASIYNACEGVEVNWRDSFRGYEVDMRIMRLIQKSPLRNETVRSNLKVLLSAIKQQVEYAGNIRVSS